MQARGLNICATVAWGVYTTADGNSTFVEIAADWRGPDVDPDTLRLGHYRAVNHGGGVRPERVSKRGGTLTARFPVEETGLEEDDGAFDDGLDRARLAAKTKGEYRAVRRTAEP